MLQWKSSKYYIFCLVVGKEAIRTHFRQKHLNRWKACEGFSQSKMLMSEPLPSRAKELQTTSRWKLKVAVGLLTVHTTLSTCMLKLRLIEWQDCRLCGDEKEDSEHVVNHCPALACKRYRTLGCMFLKPND
jgi:hypothetical protein